MPKNKGVKVRQDCPASNCGNGYVPIGPVTCSHCNGSGKRNGIFGDKVCGDCNGTGEVYTTKRCLTCNGQGFIMVNAD